MADQSPLARWARNGFTVGAGREDTKRANFQKLDANDPKNKAVDAALGAYEYTIQIKELPGDAKNSGHFKAFSKGKVGTGVTAARAFYDLQKALGVKGAYVIPKTAAIPDGGQATFKLSMR